MNDNFKGIVISGPTGVGKTNMSLVLGKKLKLDIISADASQIYREMNIGTAKITKEEMDGLKHHLLDITNPGEEYSVGDFEVEVNRILKEKNGENILIVGGTGLYIKSITDGFSKLPPKDEKIREILENKSIEEIKEMLLKLDEKSYNEIDLNNKLRLVRAVEICLITGKKFSELKTKNIKNNKYRFLKIFLTRDREELYNRINERVEIMFLQGLEGEARYIYEKYKNKLYKISSIGCKEFFRYFDGECSLGEVKDDIKRESRRYAKRQLTWFRKEKDYLIYNLSEMREENIIEEILKKWEKF
ncbi:MAG: tRNA (adenosine(37)-N6)-dimethylallyltransferase MiaA [Leptotrichiaceae bacterium]|nr:tRNA (adenosine(37)-N6)-dimethylallyltransferase MiaA [Leptotrichiaceae bacterium]